ncbi:oxidoreductase, partial [Candidatus Magnetomorum sp. HK-1]
IISNYRLDVIEVTYNLFDVRFDNFIKKCFDKKIGIIIKSPLNQGLLTGKYDDNTIFDINDVRKNYLDKAELTFRNQWIEKYLNLFSIKRNQLRENAIQFVISNPFISTVALGCNNGSPIPCSSIDTFLYFFKSQIIFLNKENSI